MKYCIKLLFVVALCIFMCCSKNHPPNKAEAAYPTNGDIDIFINIALYWSASDPDGDILTYDVYFGTSTPPPLEQSNLSEMIYDPGTLQYSTTYYWKVNSTDDEGITSESDVFEFQTMASTDDYHQYYLATGTYSSIEGNYQDPDHEMGAPWISLSSHGSSGAEAQWEFYGFPKAEVATLKLGAYSFDDGWDITGGEHYDLFNHETQEWDFLGDSNKQETWHYIELTGDDARKYVNDTTDVVIMKITSGYTDHTHIREVYCIQADLDTTAESESIPGTILFFGGMESQ